VFGYALVIARARNPDPRRGRIPSSADRDSASLRWPCPGPAFLPEAQTSFRWPHRRAHRAAPQPAAGCVRAAPACRGGLLLGLLLGLTLSGLGLAFRGLFLSLLLGLAPCGLFLGLLLGLALGRRFLGLLLGLVLSGLLLGLLLGGLLLAAGLACRLCRRLFRLAFRRRGGVLRGVRRGNGLGSGGLTLFAGALHLLHLADVLHLLGTRVLLACHFGAEHRQLVARGAGLARIVRLAHLHRLHLLARDLGHHIDVDEIVDHDVVGHARRADELGALDHAANLRLIVDHHDADVVRQEPAGRYCHPVEVRYVAHRDRYGDVHVVIAVRGRKRRPHDVVGATPPAYPGRGPAIARAPVPADLAVIAPAAIVISRPAEGLVGNPCPAIALGMGPASPRVGPPVRPHACGDEDIATPVAHPVAVGFKFVVEQREADAHRGLCVRHHRCARRPADAGEEGQGRDGAACENVSNFHCCPSACW
jgi:hypothetical protein